MKVRFFSLMVLFICSFSAFTQPFNAGLLAGGIVSQVDGDTYDGYHKFGFLAGAFVSLRISPHSSFQFEIEYIQKGSRRNGDSLSPETFLMRLHYLEIPVLFQYNLAKKVSLETGLAVDISIGDYEESYGLVVQNTVKLRPVTLGAILGINYEIINQLRLNFRLGYSLISIRDVKNGNYPPGYRHILFEKGEYNNLMSLSLIFKFKNDE